MLQKRLLHDMLIPLHSFLLSFLFLTPLFLFILSGVEGLPTPVSALDIGSVYPLANAIGNKTLGSYITPLLSTSIVGAGLIAFLIFLGGGVMIIANSGNPKQVEGGKSAITAGVIGLVLVVTAYWIIQIIEVLTGLDLLNPGF